MYLVCVVVTWIIYQLQLGFFFSDCSMLEFMDPMTQNHNFWVTHTHTHTHTKCKAQSTRAKLKALLLKGTLSDMMKRNWLQEPV